MIKVSVITVCYQAADTIETTIKSVISQTYPDIEYIIIDGGSTDGTVDVINKYADHIAYWRSEQDKGIYDAMNKGISVSTGKFINFMNAGDSFYTDSAVEEMVSKVNDDTVIAYGNTMKVYDLGEKLMYPTPLDGIKKGMVFGHQATFVDASYHKSHLFDTSFRSSGDYDFFYRSYREGAKFQYIPVTVAKYLAQHGMSSSNWSIVAKEDARIRGEENTLKWKLSYSLMIINVGMREWLKKSLPTFWVDKLKKHNFDKIGNKN